MANISNWRNLSDNNKQLDCFSKLTLQKTNTHATSHKEATNTYKQAYRQRKQLPIYFNTQTIRVIIFLRAACLC